MFLGVAAETKSWDSEGKSCLIVLKENPLAEFVVLPSCYKPTLWYSNVLCGLIRGALEMVNVKVKVYFTKDMLKGDQETEIKIELVEVMKDKYTDDSD